MNSMRQPERRQLTVMLCDRVGWTALSQRLDAEELTEVVQAYRQRCTDIIVRNGGTVAQYVGDAVLAYFGYPYAHEDDAERAVRTALDIAATERSSSDGESADVHIGIATGVVVVGNLVKADPPAPERSAGPQAHAEISAIGSALNLAARLQTLAEPGTVVVSEQTRRLNRGLFQYRDLGRHDLKGFDEPVQAWQVIEESRPRSRFHALRAPALTPLVDRQAELRELRSLWESARSGRGKAVLIASEPGVGKSRLADEIAREIGGQDSFRLWFYSAPNLQGSPLAPLVRQLTQAAGFTGGDDDVTRLRKLLALVPGAAKGEGDAIPMLANLLSIGRGGEFPPQEMAPQRRKQRLFEMLLQLLEDAASRRPVLLIVEDLHWIDPTSEELLGMIIDRSATLPVLVIFTARPEFHSHWDDRAQLRQMRLAPLDRGNSLAMIEALCGDRGVPEQTISQIADRADGLPLFIEDLTHDWLELAEQQGDSGVATNRPRAPSAIPATLSDSLMSRLDRLGSAKTVAQIGAAIGREFSYELLSRVAAQSEASLKEELRRLVAAGLLISRPSTAVLMYGFKHALVRDVAYSSLLRKDRTALHASIARALVDGFPEVAEAQPEVVAYHFQAAGDVDHAVLYLTQAAKQSARRAGFVEAVAQLQGALSLLADQPRSGARLRRELRLHLTLGGVYAEYRGFSSPECGAAYGAALELCRELGDAPEIFAVLSGVGSFEITRANFQKCRILAEECLSRAALQQTRSPHIMGHLLLGGTLFLTAEFTDARKHLEDALRLYDDDRNPHRGKQALYVQDQKSTGLSYLALTLTALGYLDRGLRAAQSGLSHSQSLGGLHTVNYSLCYLAAAHHFRRDPHGALQRATESLEMAREQGFATWIGVSQMIRGASLIATGAYEEGIAEITSGMTAHSATEAITYQTFGISLFAQGLIAGGRFDDALDALAKGLAISERTGERFYLAELLRLKGEILAGSGRLAEAEHWLREALDVARRQGARLFELRSGVSLCRVLDPPHRARALHDVLDPICKWFDAGVDAPDVREARDLLAG